MNNAKQFRLLQWYPKLPSSWKQYKGDVIVTKRGDVYVGDMTTLPASEVEGNPEYWESVETLCVDVGTKFTFHKKKEPIFEIESVSGNRVTVTWTSHGDHLTWNWDNEGHRKAIFSVEDCNRNFNEGVWVIVDYKKTYEILSLISNKNAQNTGEIINDRDNILSWERGHSNCFWDIHSVKRLSDGEVFELGQQISFKSDNPRLGNYVGTIDSFKILDDKTIDVKSGIMASFLDHVEHVDTPLFTTEDGVDIYEGDECWFYDGKRIIKTKAREGCNSPKKYKYFSTKEKADKYIEDNIPIYSKAQVEEALREFKGNAIFQRSKFRSKLDELTQK